MFLSKKSTLDIVTSVKLNGPVGHQAIALSFDDGPDWGEESLVLALNRAGMKVTFFWTWQKIQLLRQADTGRFIRLVRLITEGGHEIGIHGISCDTPSNLPERFIGVAREFENLGLIRKNFSGLLQQNPGLYRPHCFQGSTELLQAVRTSGLKLVLGSPRYQIGQRNPDILLVKAFERAKPGAIICAHDSKDCYPDFGLAEQIAQLIPQLTEIAAKRNLCILTISDILRSGVEDAAGEPQ